MKSSNIILGILICLALPACRSTTEPSQPPVHRVVAPDTTPPSPKYVLSISPHEQSVTVVDTVRLSAAALPIPVVYSWDFGDGETSTSSQPTTQHYYAGDGTYRVCIAATHNGNVVARDTSWVKVQYPSTTCADLCQHFSVTSWLIPESGPWVGIAIPILNAGEYTFNIAGNTFTAEHLHRVSVDAPSSHYDTTIREHISGSLSPNGMYLLNTQSFAYDTTYMRISGVSIPNGGNSGRTEEYRETNLIYPADSLRLIGIGLDSIVFQSTSTHNYLMPEKHTTKTIDTTSSCPPVVDIPIQLIVGRYFPNCAVRIVFRREH
jgi:hypothetical protein